MFTLGVTASIQTLSLFMISECQDQSNLATKLAIINLVAAFSGAAINPIIGAIYSYSHNISLSLFVLPMISIIGLLVIQKYMTETYQESTDCKLPLLIWS